MKRLAQWCDDVNRVQSDISYEVVYVEQEDFEEYQPRQWADMEYMKTPLLRSGNDEAP